MIHFFVHSFCKKETAKQFSKLCFLNFICSGKVLIVAEMSEMSCSHLMLLAWAQSSDDIGEPVQSGARMISGA